LRDGGFVAIGLDHFARPTDDLAAALQGGRLRRNFQGYTTDDAPILLGLGASAIGTLPQGYVQNAAPLADYRRAIEDGRLPTARGLAISEDDRLRREIIERLMCTLEVDPEEVCRGRGLGHGVFAAERESLTRMVQDGLVELDGTRIRVTEAGRPFVRVVAATFDAYLQQGGQCHSHAL
jgi:oxygen-independent coproporphyrinogen-3 oxidase